MAKTYYTDAQKQAQARWDKTNIRRVVIKLVKSTDGDIINWLENKENMQGYLKGLIRKDMTEER